MSKNAKNTKKLTINAMMAAMCAVLGYLALDMGSLKITFESLPVLISAFLFGPLDGMIVGGLSFTGAAGRSRGSINYFFHI